MQQSRETSLPWFERAGLVVVLPENALVCLPCKLALLTKSASIFRHLRETHGIELPHHSLYASQLDRLNLTDVSKVQPRPDGSLELTAVEKVRGYACLHCRHRTSS